VCNPTFSCSGTVSVDLRVREDLRFEDATDIADESTDTESSSPMGFTAGTSGVSTSVYLIIGVACASTSLASIRDLFCSTSSIPFLDCSPSSAIFSTVFTCSSVADDGDCGSLVLPSSLTSSSAVFNVDV